MALVVLVACGFDTSPRVVGDSRNLSPNDGSCAGACEQPTGGCGGDECDGSTGPRPDGAIGDAAADDRDGGEASVLGAPDGSRCSLDAECESDHCDNGLCCGGGDCCESVTDCPSVDGVAATCDAPELCQGTRGRSVCEAHRCTTELGVADDSACAADLIANDCGPYPPVACTGEKEQDTPACPSSCEEDSNCDEDAHCRGGACVADRADGGDCEDDSQCISGYCSGDVCCENGDCCGDVADCPASYSKPPTCDEPSTCQGTRNDATCIDFVCGTEADIADDSACGQETTASTCNNFDDQYCDGSPDQEAPECETVCLSDAVCDEDAYCALLSCQPDLDNGQSCSRDAQCESGHCQNGFCCDSGDCCQNGSDCSVGSYGQAPTCISSSTCQGYRVDPICNESFECEDGTSNTPDDSGCAGRLANTCGNFANVYCTSSRSQPSNQAARCDNSCDNDSDCDPGLTCTAPACTP